MSPYFHSRVERFFAIVFTLTLLVLTMSFAALAQNDNPPKVDVFVGYQWLNPGGTVPVGGFSPFVQQPNTPVPTKLPGMPIGWGSTGTYNFDRHWGLSLDGGGNYSDPAHETTISVGPRYMIRAEGLNVFAHAMLGLNRLAPKGVPASNGLGAILGGGIDLPLIRAISLRLIEADYVAGRQNFSSVVGPQDPDLRHPVMNGVRLRTGMVLNFGGGPTVPPAATCTVSPTEVMVGEPITATVATTNFDPKHTLTYNWTSNGGKVTGKDTTASIDTTGMTGGSYTVTSHVVDAKQKKMGDATCTANFTVKEPPKNPPTMSCSANPTTVQTGSPATITCTCTSPDGVPVNVAAWSATGGSISGSGNTATLNTTGASAGPITVSATCTDSRGLTGPASTTVTVENPPPPPPQASKLSSCDFPNKVKPWRVDNTCKAVLDDVAQRLQHEPDAKLVIVGNADPTEKRKNLAGERAVDSKAYLSGGEAKQGIDASRIETRTGSAGTKTADYWIVPAGATFNAEGTQAVDESAVPAVPDHPKPAAKKKGAAKPKAQ
jgi:outer membrane protein OmpA-like peptidoglycan-associated protein